VHGKDFSVLSGVLRICTVPLHKADVILQAFGLNSAISHDYYLFSNSLKKKKINKKKRKTRWFPVLSKGRKGGHKGNIQNMPRFTTLPVCLCKIT